MVVITASVMTKMVDNTWIDEVRRLPDGTPGIIIEGRDGGTTDWDSSDIVTQLGVGAGTFKDGPAGTYLVNTPIQFGLNDTTTHGFTDTNVFWLWEDQEFAPTALYGLTAPGNSGGTTTVTLGVKTGSGDDATGAQGAIISAAATGVRWVMDFDDPDLDGINLYGCQLIHGGAFLLNDPAVSVISSVYLDCDSALVSNSEQLRNAVIDANTADGVAFMTTDDLSDIVFGDFQFSDGHGVELTTPNTSSQTSKGNLFTGYGSDATNDAAVYNNSGAGLVTISVTSGGDSPTVRNGTSASTTVVNNTEITLTGLVDPTEVRVFAAGTTTPELAGQENVTTGSFVFSRPATEDVDIRIFAVTHLPADVLGFTIPAADTTLPIQQIFDRSFENPA